MNSAGLISVGLIGAGRMGSFHAETLARRLPGTRLAAIADPAPGAAQKLAQQLAQQLADRLGGGPRALTDPGQLLADPAIDAVVIVTPARTHAGLVEAAARAGKAVYCEKPMALTLADADRAIDAARQAGVPLQVGFNRRYDAGFRAARDTIDAGAIGTPQLLRSLTRDPELADPARIPPWTIFTETLNPGAEPAEVFALADALIRPDFKDRGLLDTAVVTVRFDNGALATAEASFQAVYGYDVRGEVLGSAGLLTVGDLRSTHLTSYGPAGLAAGCVRYDQDLFRDAYIAELADFADCARTGRTPAVTGQDARAALAVARAAIQSVTTASPVRIDELKDD
jgi:myo-inositol 2-dehydrogenase / D-chiro-inositol 1-dehydrogenase